MIKEINAEPDVIKQIALKAGKEILKIYNEKSYIIQHKDDDSPVTTADNAANEIIVNELNRLFPDVTVISEEQINKPYKERKNQELLFCVDPLDGTSNFVKRNGEFCVNIALIKDSYPVYGVIYIPMMRTFYYGGKNYGSYKQIYINEPDRINVNNEHYGGITLAVSRTHFNPKDEVILETLDIADKIVIGSAIKYGLIAEGTADLYYRNGPTMEWDSAAGQAIVEGAGGRVTDLTGTDLIYNKENLENPPFFCLSSHEIFKK
jgi:3'(2'), 5'-bisphosphate nucleotidase